jgi:colanic acid biosynthesis glycosyl transferase WcaI
MFSHWYDPEGHGAAGPGTIARALRDRGHDVHVVTGFPNYPTGIVFPGYKVRPYHREVLEGVTVHRSAIYASHNTGAVRRAANYLSFACSGAINGVTRLPPVDVAFVYSTPATTAIPGMVLRALRGVPYVVQIQDMWPQTVTSSGFVKGAGVGRTERVLHRFCDAVYQKASTIAVTSPGMRGLVEMRGIDPKKIEYVPNWADEKCFVPTTVTPALVDEFGPFRPFTAMYAGNFGELQALHNLIEAASLLRDDKDIGFVLVGGGVTEDRLRSRVAELGLDNVRFVPSQPFSRMSDVLALGGVQLISLKDVPMMRSTLPSKIQANMAAGRPIIGAVAGDAASVITMSGAGFVSGPEDPVALADAVKKMARLSESERQAMGVRARSFYLEHYSEQVVGDHISRLLTAARRTRKTRRSP